MNCSGPVPMEFGSETRNNWQGTARTDGSHGAKHSEDPRFRCNSSTGAVWQGLNVAGSTKATKEPYQQSQGLWMRMEPRLGLFPSRSVRLPNGGLRSQSKGPIHVSMTGDKYFSVDSVVFLGDTDGDRYTYNGLTRPGSNCISGVPG